MGNTATSLLTLTYFGTSPIALGASGGSQSHTPAAADVPSGAAVTIAGTLTVSVGGGNVPTTAGTWSNNTGSTTGTSGGDFPQGSSAVGNASSFSGPGSTLTATTNGAGTPYPTVTPMKLTTIYIKL